MTRIHRFGDLQLAILRVLWRRKEASAAEVQADLARERGLALSTIATTLKRLSAQGVVRHRSEGRHYLFSAVVGESDVRESMVSDLVKRLFRGDSAALVSHLVEAGEVEPGELDDLRATVKRRARRGSKNDA